MIYDYKNTTRGTRVFDVDTKQEIKQVMRVDTDAGTVEHCTTPLKVVGDGIVTATSRYTSIHAITDGGVWPCLFHCYGLIGESIGIVKA